jgi:hypothetical protein
VKRAIPLADTVPVVGVSLGAATAPINLPAVTDTFPENCRAKPPFKFSLVQPLTAPATGTKLTQIVVAKNKVQTREIIESSEALLCKGRVMAQPALWCG